MNPKDFEIAHIPTAEPKPVHQQGMTHEQLQADVRVGKIRGLREQAAYQVREWTRAGYRLRKDAEEEIYQELLAKFLEKEAENQARRARQEAARIRQAEARLEAEAAREQEIEDALLEADPEELRSVIRAQREFIQKMINIGRLRPTDIPPDLR